MIHKVKDLSPDQRLTLEGLLGCAIGEHEHISIRSIASPCAPDWLKKSWETAQEEGLDRLSEEEIEAETAAARNSRRERRPPEK
jgi:hypothetical protein